MKTTSTTMETVTPAIRTKEDEAPSVLRSRPELGRGRIWRRKNKTIVHIFQSQSSNSITTKGFTDSKVDL